MYIVYQEMRPVSSNFEKVCRFDRLLLEIAGRACYTIRVDWLVRVLTLTRHQESGETTVAEWVVKKEYASRVADMLKSILYNTEKLRQVNESVEKQPK